MDQHPVPQDITGFQFKLVGDMTLKQFGYLAGGAVTAWVFYVTDWNPVIKIPMAFFTFVFGVALAFLPIQERPLETWIVNFFKSVYKPTQYVWKKSQNQLEFLNNKPTPSDLPIITTVAPPTNEEKLKTYLDTIAPNPPLPPQPTVDDLLAKTQAGPPPEPAPEQKPPTENIDVNDLLRNREDKNQQLQDELKKITEEVRVEYQNNLPKAPETPTVDDLTRLRDIPQKIDEKEAVNRKLLIQIEEMNQKMMALAKEHKTKDEETSEFQRQLKQMQETLDALKSEKENLTKETERLSNELKMSQRGIRPHDPDARVKFIDKMPIQSATAGGQLPPNTIHGLVDDQKGLAITGVIVLIKNSQGSPVRALRTNKLGQFYATTPLENGTYYIELEKDGYTFDEVKLDLKGKTLSPLEIKAK